MRLEVMALVVLTCLSTGVEAQEQSIPISAPPTFFERVTHDPLMAALTLGLLVFAGIQVWISRETARRQLRAYLCVRGVTLREFFSESKLHVRIEFLNAGSTPAHDVNIQTAVRLGPYPPNADDDFSIPPTTDKSLAPAPPQGIKGISIPLARSITEEEFEGVRTGTLAVYAWGRAEYRDVFSRTHETMFRYVATGARRRVDKESMMTPLEAGNSAT